MGSRLPVTRHVTTSSLACVAVHQAPFRPVHCSPKRTSISIVCLNLYLPICCRCCSKHAAEIASCATCGPPTQRSQVQRLPVTRCAGERQKPPLLRALAPMGRESPDGHDWRGRPAGFPMGLGFRVSVVRTCGAAPHHSTASCSDIRGIARS